MSGMRSTQGRKEKVTAYREILLGRYTKGHMGGRWAGIAQAV